MRKLALAIAVSTPLGINVAPANATMTVTPALDVHNKCNRDIAIAVHYKDLQAGGWRNTPFVVIRANGYKDRIVSSDNSIFYYYAETVDGGPKVAWDGNERNETVQGRTVSMRMKQLTFDRDQNQYRLNLTCR
jgi:hypothetical protein